MTIHKDQMNQRVDLVELPQRIVSLVPSQTELLHYWGLGDRVLGITKFCVHPEVWYRNKKRVGGTKTVNFETIKALKPDLIIGNKEENTQSDIEQLMQEYPVWMSDMQSLAEVWEMMTLLGQVLGVEDEASQLVAKLQQDFETLKDLRKGQQQLKVAYLIWQNPYMVAASGTFIHTMLECAGFENAFANEKRYPETNMMDLAKLDLDVIFLSSEPFPFKEKHVAAFQEACPNTRVEIVDGEIFSWYGSRLLHALDYIKKLREKLFS